MTFIKKTPEPIPEEFKIPEEEPQKVIITNQEKKESTPYDSITSPYYDEVPITEEEVKYQSENKE